MNEKPIIFSGEMVRAILAGRKTQTRRALKKQPVDIIPMKVPSMWVTLRIQDKQNPENNRGDLIGCRFGIPGDRLWVREAFRELIDLGAGTNSSSNYYEYKADRASGDIDFNPDVKWSPSIHMPRWASRITLEIVSVRVERLKKITHKDIDAEGTPPIPDQMSYRNDGYQRYKDFQYLWDSLNKKRGYGWDANPFVWVIEFKQVKQ